MGLLSLTLSNFNSHSCEFIHPITIDRNIVRVPLMYFHIFPVLFVQAHIIRVQFNKFSLNIFLMCIANILNQTHLPFPELPMKIKIFSKLTFKFPVSINACRKSIAKRTISHPNIGWQGKIYTLLSECQTEHRIKENRLFCVEWVVGWWWWFLWLYKQHYLKKVLFLFTSNVSDFLCIRRKIGVIIVKNLFFEYKERKGDNEWTKYIQWMTI